MNAQRYEWPDRNVRPLVFERREERGERREQRTENREQRTENREQSTEEVREGPGTSHVVPAGFCGGRSTTKETT